MIRYECDRCGHVGSRRDILSYRFGIAEDGSRGVVLDPVSNVDLCPGCRRCLIEFLKPLPREAK